jgi:hypothetical protein
MPTAIFVPGPTTIHVATTAGSYVQLGLSDNDNLPSISFTDHQHEVRTVTSGAVPEEIVLQNIEAMVTVALVKWDADILENLLIDQRGAAYTNTVGRRLVANNGFFGLRIRSIAAGLPGYTFTHAFLRQDGMSDSQWGNRERVLSLNFRCIPDPATNVLCTYTNI